MSTSILNGEHTTSQGTMKHFFYLYNSWLQRFGKGFSSRFHCASSLGRVLMVLLLLLSGPVGAGQNIDEVRVLIDISGSMKQSDPHNLRSEALKLFVSLLPAGTHAGVWTFGQWVNMLVKPGAVDGQWKSAARAAADEINSHGMYTNIEEVIRDSTWDWMRPAPGHRRSLILLTDGLVDISKNTEENAASRNRILEMLLPRLRSAGIKINTIALSGQSDVDLLRQLSAATDGWFEITETAEALEKLFFRLFEKVATTNTLPLTDNLVTVDGSIKEVTFLIFRKSEEDKDISLTTPSSITYSRKNHPSAIQWHEASRYDLITISNPEPGDWKINATLDPDNRVMVVSDLLLKTTELSNDLAAGKPITYRVHLEQAGEIIRREEFLQFVTVTLTQTSMSDQQWQWNLADDGQVPDEAARDGVFTGVISESLTEGEHELEVGIDGTTFKRNARQLVRIYSHPISINTSTLGEGKLAISLVPYQSLIDVDSISLEAIHHPPSGQKNNVNVPRTSTSEWRIELDEHEHPGKHTVTFHVKGKSPDGEEIESTLPPIEFEITSPKETASPASAEATTNQDSVDQPISDEKTDWLMIGLRLFVLNIFILAFAFAGIKLWPIIRRLIIPTPSEILANANQ